jgi:hypothetical protein
MAWSLLASVPLAIFAAAPVAERLARGEIDGLRADMAGSQQAAVLNTFLGRTDLNASLTGLPIGAQPCAREGVEATPAVEWLEANAGSARVVMFNENHYAPQSRAFVTQLLPLLKRLGFTHIGFETLNNSGNVPGTFGPADGYYTLEPLFAGLIRAANSQGFTVFAYEADYRTLTDVPMNERIAVREEGEARNLQMIVSGAPAAARFIVFAGWSHITEAPLPGVDPAGDRWMANRFKEKTGIDPLTIDLTTCAIEASRADAREARIYKKADGAVRVVGQYSGAVDAQIALPVPTRNGPASAGFFRSVLGRPVRVPAKLHPTGTEVLIEARPIDAASTDVAFDRVLLRADEDLPLYLPKGKFRLTSWKTDGTRVGGATIRTR